MIRRLSALLWFLMIATFAGSTPAMAAGKPDFSDVTSREKAEALVREGRLVRIYLFPVTLGGPRRKENRSYLPPEAAEALGLITGTLERFTREGTVDRLEVDPDYRGDSFVPTRIVMRATHSSLEGGFYPTIKVW